MSGLWYQNCDWKSVQIHRRENQTIGLWQCRYQAYGQKYHQIRRCESQMYGLWYQYQPYSQNHLHGHRMYYGKCSLVWK